MASAVHIPKGPLKTHEAPRPSFGRRGLDSHMIDPGSTGPMSRPTPVATATVWETSAQPTLRMWTYRATTVRSLIKNFRRGSEIDISVKVFLHKDQSFLTRVKDRFGQIRRSQKVFA